LLFQVSLILLVAISGCGQREDKPVPSPSTSSTSPADESPSESARPNAVLRLASTTSTRDSGLFDVLLPAFEDKHNCRVDVIAVGTGAALKLGESGDVDAVLVHARAAEEAFMQAGHGVRHEPVMHNFFIIVGPQDDPAGVTGLPADKALQKIAAAGQVFVSRGDDSGTHKKELAIWKLSGERPDWDGYLEAGQGMGPTLVIADEKNAYVLTDEGTWLKRRNDFRLKPVVEGDDQLRNPYAVMVVNPERHTAINSGLANTFADFLISEEAQRLIAGYQVNRQSLFHPDRLAAESAE
jgi:tungstate transport system substrate-binding protein